MPEAPAPSAAPSDAHLIELPLTSTTLLSGGFLEVRKDTVRLPDGRSATREFVQHPGAVAVIPMLDDGRLVLVRQHRYPVNKVLLEWPAGKLDVNENTLACAQRELQEETGYTATEWAYAGEMHNAAAYSSESIWLWFARGLKAGPTRLDDGEFVETVALTLPELLALDAQGSLFDVKTLVGLHWLQQCLSGQRPWNWQPAQGADGSAPL